MILGRVENVLLDLHMIFIHVDFIIMDMDGKVHSPIIFGRPFLRNIGATIDANEGNVNSNCYTISLWSTFQRRRREQIVASVTCAPPKNQR
jgi:hypothetical protein